MLPRAVSTTKRAPPRVLRITPISGACIENSAQGWRSSDKAHLPPYWRQAWPRCGRGREPDVRAPGALKDPVKSYRCRSLQPGHGNGSQLAQTPDRWCAGGRLQPCGSSLEPSRVRYSDPRSRRRAGSPVCSEHRGLGTAARGLGRPTVRGDGTYLYFDPAHASIL